MSSTFVAGVATGDITPKPYDKFKLFGIPRKDFTRGVLHPIRAEALALRCGDAPLWIVTCDQVFVRESLTDPVRRRVAEALGRDTVNMMFGATHCHSAELEVPDDATPELKTVLQREAQRMEDALVEACLEAHAQMVPAEAASVSATLVEPLGACRRMRFANGTCVEHWPGGSPSIPGEKRMGVEAPPPDRIALIGLRSAESGKLLALLTSYDSHIHLIPLPMTDGETAGAAKREIERRHPGVTVLYTTGMAGDIAMNPSSPPPASGGDAQQAWYEAQMAALGCRFADAVDQALGEFAFRRPENVRFAEFRSNEPRDEMMAHQPHAGILIQAAALGNAAILNVQGELFSEYGRAIRAACPFPNLVIVGYNEKGYSYIGTDLAYEQGSYEIKGVLSRTDAEEQAFREMGAQIIPRPRAAVGHVIVKHSCDLLRGLQAAGSVG